MHLTARTLAELSSSAATLRRQAPQGVELSDEQARGLLRAFHAVESRFDDVVETATAVVGALRAPEVASLKMPTMVRLSRLADFAEGYAAGEVRDNTLIFMPGASPEIAAKVNCERAAEALKEPAPEAGGRVAAFGRQMSEIEGLRHVAYWCLRELGPGLLPHIHDELARCSAIDAGFLLHALDGHLDKPEVRAFYRRAFVDATDESVQNAAANYGKFEITPLHLAAHHGHLSKLEVPDSADLLEALEPGGNTALMLAAGGGHLACVERLLEFGADPNTLGKRGAGPAHYAAIAGEPAILAALARAGADLTVATQAGSDVLSFAVGSGVEMVVLALEHGASARGNPDRSLTPLMSAMRAGNLDVAELLLQHGADLRDTHRGVGVVFMATQAEGLDALKWCLERGAPVETPNPEGVTPLILAAAQGQAQKVRLLLAANADPSAKTHDGQTARELAQENGYPEVVALL